jgi:hypothetical protein
MGGLVVMVGTFGLVRAGWRKHTWAIALIAFGLVYYVLIGRAEVKFLRYVFPLLPLIAVGFGWIVGRAKEHPRMVLQALLIFVSVFGVADALRRTTLYSTWMMEADPRIALADEIKKVATEDTTVGLASDPWFYTPTLYPQSALGPYAGFEKRMEWMRAAKKPRVLRYMPESGTKTDFDKRLLTELKPDYVVVSSFEIGDLNRLNQLPSPPSEFSAQLRQAEEFMDTLSTEYELWKVRGLDGAILPHDMMYIRPEVQVWKRKTDSPTPSTGSSTTSEPNEEPATTP